MTAHRRVVAALAVMAAATACSTSPATPGAPSSTATPAAAGPMSTTPPSAQPPGVLPDRAQTSGAVANTDPAVVCAPGYSRSVRPPAAYTTALKRRQLAAGYPGTAGRTAADVEEDHLVMLALGGDPRSPQNLWPEPRHITAADGGEGGAAAKDECEGRLSGQVCHQHRVALADAQRALATDWYDAWTAAGRPRAATSNID